MLLSQPIVTQGPSKAYVSFNPDKVKLQPHEPSYINVPIKTIKPITQKPKKKLVFSQYPNKLKSDKEKPKIVEKTAPKYTEKNILPGSSIS
jgi:hypothetical protein